jgi:hypothetical protein
LTVTPGTLSSPANSGLPAAEEEVLDALGIELRDLGQHLAHDERGEVVRTHVHQGPLEGATDGGAAGGDYDGFGHWCPPRSYYLVNVTSIEPWRGRTFELAEGSLVVEALANALAGPAAQLLGLEEHPVRVAGVLARTALEDLG